MSPRSTWTDEASDLCVKYWLDGLSSSLIATRMGISRNAVLGRMHRLGLAKGTPGQSKIQVNRDLKSRVAGRPRKPRLSPLTGFASVNGPIAPQYPMPVRQADDKARVSFENLEDHHCRFIPGEVSEGYCGLERVPGQSYCVGHLHRCYTPAQTTRHMAVHERAGGEHTVAATTAEFLEPA